MQPHVKLFSNYVKKMSTKEDSEIEDIMKILNHS